MEPTKIESAAKAPPTKRLAPTKPQLGKCIRFGEGVYNEVMQFLIEEARLLDDGLLNDWLKLLAPDLFYFMPVRRTVARSDGNGFDPNMNWFNEDITTLGFKVRRLTKTESGYAENPPSRVRRFVTNMMAYETAVVGEYLAQSYLLLLRSRGNAHDFDIVSARRDDIVRRCSDGWKLAQRVILIDQAVLGTNNLAVFL